MILYLLFFLAGGFSGIVLMSMLCLGRKDDELSSEMYKNI